MSGQPNETFGYETTDFLAHPPVLIQPPSVDQEWARVANYLNNPTLYGDMVLDYLSRLPLPQYPPFPDVISEVMAKGEAPSSDVLGELGHVFYNEVFNATAYDAGIGLLEQTVPVLEQQVFPIMRGHQASLGFYLPPEGYRTTLSRFGTTGSYMPRSRDNEDQSSVTVLFTGEEDQEVVLGRLIHEIAHIGLAERLITKGGFGHTEKELAVDSYVRAHFGHLLPRYESQSSRALDTAKFEKHLAAVLYIARLGGISVPETSKVDPGAVRRMMSEYSTLGYLLHEGQDRYDSPIINSPAITSCDPPRRFALPVR